MNSIHDKIPILDHGYVRLEDYMGTDETIVRAARVSHNRDQDPNYTSDKAAKLIAYLWANKHTSPFEHVQFTFEIKCPIFVARQWFRHRTGKYNEISGRYTELPAEYYVPDESVITRQDPKNHQSRTGEQLGNAEYIRDSIKDACNEAIAYYQRLLSAGCARELARSVLPLSIYTRFYFTIDLHNLAHFLELRLDSHSQYEIQVYARAMLKVISGIVPVAVHTMGLGQYLGEQA